MSKKISLSLFAAIFLALAGFGLLIPQLLHMFKPASKPLLGSIVRLVSDDGMTFCSGTVIKNDIILTAAHCVRGYGPIEIRARDNVNRGTLAQPIMGTPQLDQAILRGDFTIFETRPFISEPGKLLDKAKKNTRYISCGYPFNGDLFCNETIFQRYDNFAWAMDGMLIPGMSGGPTMTTSGIVVGVNVAVDRELSMITPIYNILERLNGDH